jgi:hypothetical protein
LLADTPVLMSILFGTTRIEERENTLIGDGGARCREGACTGTYSPRNEMIVHAVKTSALKCSM